MLLQLVQQIVVTGGGKVRDKVGHCVAVDIHLLFQRTFDRVAFHYHLGDIALIDQFLKAGVADDVGALLHEEKIEKGQQQEHYDDEPGESG